MLETDPRAPRITPPPVAISRWYGVIVGTVSAAVAVGAGILIASFGAAGSPIDAVGSSFIDRAPSWLKDFAITFFGTNNKLALRVGIWCVLAIVAAILGANSTHTRTPLMYGFVVFSVLGVGAAAERPLTSTYSIIAPVVGGAIGIACMWYLTSFFQLATKRNNTPSESQVPLEWDRRRFMQTAGAVAAIAVTTGAIGQFRTNRRFDTARSQIPTALPPVPANELVNYSEIAFHPTDSFITPTKSFYRIDTALSFPTVNLDNWRLQIKGMVNQPLELSYEQLLALPQVERIITLSCVSNPVGGRYIGNAIWQGVKLIDVLELAGVNKNAEQLFSRSIDGWTCGFPLQVALDGRDALIAIGMNGKPLSLKHGFPARLVVPGLYGYVSATKWLSEIEITSWDKEGYWIPRGWSREGPIKTQSRIDVPRIDETIAPGATTVAGTAWAMPHGVARVEVRIDDGPWQEATLSPVAFDDTWRQWTLSWYATPGEHFIQVRTTDTTGYTQTETRSDVAPDGATGWHTRKVRV